MYTCIHVYICVHKSVLMAFWKPVSWHLIIKQFPLIIKCIYILTYSYAIILFVKTFAAQFVITFVGFRHLYLMKLPRLSFFSVTFGKLFSANNLSSALTKQQAHNFTNPGNKSKKQGLLLGNDSHVLTNKHSWIDDGNKVYHVTLGHFHWREETSGVLMMLLHSEVLTFDENYATSSLPRASFICFIHRMSP